MKKFWMGLTIGVLCAALIGTGVFFAAKKTRAPKEEVTTTTAAENAAPATTAAQGIVPTNPVQDTTEESTTAIQKVTFDLQGADSVDNAVGAYLDAIVGGNPKEFRNVAEFQIYGHEDLFSEGLAAFYALDDAGKDKMMSYAYEGLRSAVNAAAGDYWADFNLGDFDINKVKYSYDIIGKGADRKEFIPRCQASFGKYYKDMTVEAVRTDVAVDIHVSYHDKSMDFPVTFDLVKANGKWYIYRLELQQ